MRQADFFDPLMRVKLVLFNEPIKKVSSLGKGNHLESTKNLFWTISLIGQMNLKMLLSFPLGPILWVLAASDRYLRKTNKACLATSLEKFPAESILVGIACVTDAMSFDHFLFYETVQTLHRKGLLESEYCYRAGVALGAYKEYSIKNVERINECGAYNATKFKNIIGGYIIKQ